MQRLLRKFETAKTLVPRPLLYPAEKPARFGAIFYGSTSPAMQEALDVLAERGIHVNALRVRAFPFQEEINDFVASHPWVFVIEQNRDAQLKSAARERSEVERRHGCSRSCTTTARRSPRASSSTRSRSTPRRARSCL